MPAVSARKQPLRLHMAGQQLPKLLRRSVRLPVRQEEGAGGRGVQINASPHPVGGVNLLPRKLLRRLSFPVVGDAHALRAETKRIKSLGSLQPELFTCVWI